MIDIDLFGLCWTTYCPNLGSGGTVRYECAVIRFANRTAINNNGSGWQWNGRLPFQVNPQHLERIGDAPGEYSQDAEERTYLTLVRGFECSLIFEAVNIFSDLKNENRKLM